MSYTLAIITFLLGSGLGVSVARRRMQTASDGQTAAPVASAAPVVQLRGVAAGPQLASSEEILAAAFDALPSGVVIADVDATILFKNLAAKAISGVRHIDVLVEEAVVALVQSGVDVETQHRRFDTAGSPARSFDIRTKRLSDHRIVATVEDVTEQSRIDTVRTDFVANLSHELKTPIGGIAALADTMIGETDPQIIERLSARIVDESYRLSRIVDDLLDLSRIEFGGADDWDPVAITDVVNEVVARTQHEAIRAGVSVVAKNVSGVRVLGDRMQLVSALENLVSNAVKYSGDGKLVLIEVQPTSELVSIAVIDQGIGIGSKDHQRIFERFYRVDRARSRSTGGSGLGLSIVRHVASNHGGNVTVVSEEGRGSTFTIVLPRDLTVSTELGQLDEVPVPSNLSNLPDTRSVAI